MAPTQNKKVAADFNNMIKADREKRKNETLAKEIFGRNRRQSAPAAGPAARKAGTGPSLASRVGVTKAGSQKPHTRSAAVALGGARRTAQVPAGNVDADWTHDLHTVNNPSRNIPTGPSGRINKNVRKARLQGVLNGSASSPNLNSQFNVVNKNKGVISIRGIAGPCIVQAENFAPGTTAADIESAMAAVGGKILKCSLIATSPDVIAEIVFETKEGANCVVETFHLQTADGRILNVFVKPGKVSTDDLLAPRAEPAGPAIPLGPRADIDRQSGRSGRYADTPRYSARDDRDRGRNDGRSEVVDGSYGFDDDRMETDEYETAKPLYSDNIVGRDRDAYQGRSDNPRRGDGRDRGRGNRGRGYR